LCRHGAERTMAVMAKRAEAHLMIERDGEHVLGELHDEHGAVSAFSGWLDLISALDSLATPVRETAQTTCTADRRTSWQCNEMTDQPRREP
jgi:hypothetical protein